MSENKRQKTISKSRKAKQPVETTDEDSEDGKKVVNNLMIDTSIKNSFEKESISVNDYDTDRDNLYNQTKNIIGKSKIRKGIRNSDNNDVNILNRCKLESFNNHQRQIEAFTSKTQQVQPLMDTQQEQPPPVLPTTSPIVEETFINDTDIVDGVPIYRNRYMNNTFIRKSYVAIIIMLCVLLLTVLILKKFREYKLQKDTAIGNMVVNSTDNSTVTPAESNMVGSNILDDFINIPPSVNMKIRDERGRFVKQK